MTQETMGEGRKIIEALGKVIKEWKFLSLDAKGCPMGLITGGKINLLLLNHYFFVVSIYTYCMVNN